MRQLLEKLFPILSKNETTVEKSWNLYDFMNLLEVWTFLLLKTALGTCLSLILEVLKFILILLLTYAFALAVFYVMDIVFPNSGNQIPIKKTKSQSDFDNRQQKSSEEYPYLVNYNSEEENVKVRNSTTPYQTKGFESEISDDAVVRVGSFKRPSSASADGEGSAIGRAIEDLKNAHTPVNAPVNENEIEAVRSNLSRESNSSRKFGERKSSTRND